MPLHEPQVDLGQAIGWTAFADERLGIVTPRNRRLYDDALLTFLERPLLPVESSDKA